MSISTFSANLNYAVRQSPALSGLSATQGKGAVSAPAGDAKAMSIDAAVSDEQVRHEGKTGMPLVPMLASPRQPAAPLTAELTAALAQAQSQFGLDYSAVHFDAVKALVGARQADNQVGAQFGIAAEKMIQKAAEKEIDAAVTSLGAAVGGAAAGLAMTGAGAAQKGRATRKTTASLENNQRAAVKLRNVATDARAAPIEIPRARLAANPNRSADGGVPLQPHANRVRADHADALNKPADNLLRQAEGLDINHRAAEARAGQMHAKADVLTTSGSMMTQVMRSSGEVASATDNATQMLARAASDANASTAKSKEEDGKDSKAHIEELLQAAQKQAESRAATMAAMIRNI